MAGAVTAPEGGDDFAVAFRVLFPPAYRIAYRVLGNVEDAEDAAAEALARALLKWPQVRDLPHREAWVMRVVTNVAIDTARKRGRMRARPEVLSTDEEEATVLRVALVQALRRLPRRQRQVVAMRYLAGLPQREVAVALGISEESVKTHAARAAARLRLGLGAGWTKEEAIRAD